jgi:hypothetical protein
MIKDQIIKLKDNYFNYSDTIDELKSKLNTYEINYGFYSVKELQKAISQKKPCFIENKNSLKMIVGLKDGCLIDSNLKSFKLAGMCKAIIVDDIKENETEDNRDDFIIIGENNWDDIDDFINVFGSLKVGEIYLPPHSAIFNFRDQTEEEENNNIVSKLEGVNITILNIDNYIDNAIHEVGHLFYRDCLNYEEREALKEFHNNLKPSALYNYKWESNDPEEMFCTFYKWYVKSLLIHKSFYNIFKHEEPKGLELLQSIFDRIAQSKIIEDNWQIVNKAITDYFNPKFNVHSKQFIRTSKFTSNIKVPDKILNTVNKVENGIEYITLKKADIPIKNKIIQKEYPMKKANDKPVIYMDMDGVVADFVKGYKDMTGRNAHEDDLQTINFNCALVFNFFRKLPILEKGKELFKELDKFCRIVFLTTPMDSVITCRRDKIEWIKEHFGNYDIIFSYNKQDYAKDDCCILIDDMDYNLKPFSEAGGTAINFKDNNNKIINKIKQVFNLDMNESQIKKEIAVAVRNTNRNPTEAQKEAGNYAKGKFNYKGLEISIENPKGSVRWGIGFGGKKWRNVMKNHYGYIKKTNGADDDHIDIFLGDNLKSTKVFVINQYEPNANIFDEHKIMLGFSTSEEAKQAYLSNYNTNWQGFGSITQCTMTEFKKWLKSGNMDMPYFKEMKKTKKITNIPVNKMGDVFNTGYFVN